MLKSVKSMANIRSSIKAIRVAKRRSDINEKIRKEYRGVKRNINKALENGEISKAEELVPTYQSAVDKAVKKGTIHKNTANRYKSRIIKTILEQKDSK